MTFGAPTSVGGLLDGTEALVVVVIGGLGSIIGTFVAAILVSELNAFGILVLPGVSLALSFVVMAAVLVVKPTGLFGAKDANGDPGLSLMIKIIVAVVFAFVCGGIAVRGITGSTMTRVFCSFSRTRTALAGVAAAWSVETARNSNDR